MNQSRHEIVDAESAFSERDILDETCRFGDWQDHVTFESRDTESSPSSDSTDVRLRAGDSAGAPIATQTRVP